MNNDADTKTITETKRVQLGILQTRIALHGTRMWQLPLTYLGLIAISLNALKSESPVFPTHIVFFLLAILGIIMTWCLYGAHRRYQQTVDDANELEAELKLSTYTLCDIYHTYPYYALMVFGALCCTVASVVLLKQ